MNLFAVLVALGMYAQTFVVADVEITPASENTNEIYTLILMDYNGNLWEVNADDGDWFPGDIVTAIMYTNETETIYDEEFVCVTYSGTIEGYVENYLFPEDLQAIE